MIFKKPQPARRMPQPFASGPQVLQGNDFRPQFRHHRQFDLFIGKDMDWKALKLPDGKLMGERFHSNKPLNSPPGRLSKLFGEEH